MCPLHSGIFVNGVRGRAVSSILLSFLPFLNCVRTYLCVFVFPQLQLAPLPRISSLACSHLMGILPYLRNEPIRVKIKKLTKKVLKKKRKRNLREKARVILYPQSRQWPISRLMTSLYMRIDIHRGFTVPSSPRDRVTSCGSHEF